MHNHRTYHSLNAEAQAPGEGEGQCRWWCRFKKRLKSRGGSLLGALVSGNIIGAVVGFVETVIDNNALERSLGDIQIDGDDLLTANEKILMEEWQDNVFVKFLQRVEILIISNTYTNMNLALRMMYAYEFALKQQAANVMTSFDGLSKQALGLRHVYVKNVISDIINALSTKPSTNMQFSAEDVRGEILATSPLIIRDLSYLRGSVNGLMYVVKTGLPPDDIVIIPVYDVVPDKDDDTPVKPTPPSNSGSTLFKWLGIGTAIVVIGKAVTGNTEKKSKKTK